MQARVANSIPAFGLDYIALMDRAHDLFESLIAEGELGIDRLIGDRQSEELFLDFKRSNSDGAGKSLHVEDRTNLAKAISGFGNSEGGVIVWGVDCRIDAKGNDLPNAKRPLVDAAGFASRLESAVSGCTVPPHSNVRHHVISDANGPSGFVVTLVPRSPRQPHQTTRPLQYYMRAGSSFVVVPHGVMAGMFGRAPQPTLECRLHCQQASKESDGSLWVTFAFHLYSHGPVIATDLFASFTVDSFPSGSSRLDFQTGARWESTRTNPDKFAAVGEHGCRLAPEAFSEPIFIHMQLRNSIDVAIRLTGVAGAANSIPTRFAWECDAVRVRETLAAFQGRGEPVDEPMILALMQTLE